MASATAWASWTHPAWRPYLWPLGGYFSLCAGLIAHGHNHCPVFLNRGANQVMSWLATIFYGFPSFVWVAVHNDNHHRLSNAPGDSTATWKVSNKHNLLVAGTYPFVSMLYQQPVVGKFVLDAWKNNRSRFWACVSQYVIFWGGAAFALWIDWRAFVWAFALPWFCGVYMMIYFNYAQHVHCDPYSDWSHSRDWTGKLLNFLLFNNGFHTVHHNRPGVHWSKWGQMHEEVKDKIPLELQEKSLAWWLVRQYLLAPFFPSLGSKQIGGLPWEPPPGRVPTGTLVQAASADSL